MKIRIKNKRAQLKIQEMAFVLVAIVIFFALISLVFFSVRINSLKKQASLIQEEQTASLVRHISGTPELSWKACSGCIDLDKAIALKKTGTNAYSSLWELDYLMIERIYPEHQKRECVYGNYPECNSLVLINSTKDYGITSTAFVSLCFWNSEKSQEICELGRIYASGSGVKR